MAKTALISGGARGIGRVTAMRLLLDGWNVAITYHSSKDAAHAFQKEANSGLSHDKPRLVVYEADVRDAARAQAVVETIVTNFGSLDALINNASSFFQTPVGEPASAAMRCSTTCRRATGARSSRRISTARSR